VDAAIPLTHRGGLALDVPPMIVVPTETMEDRFRTVLATKLAYNPGTSKGYSNIGYLALGMVVEAVTGRKYEDVCREAALDPMGVTGMIDPALKQRAPNGGWLMSAIDYARLCRFLTIATRCFPDAHTPGLRLRRAGMAWARSCGGCRMASNLVIVARSRVS
jgi:CubicO group peptidase (beta-lactamase class C family)